MLNVFSTLRQVYDLENPKTPEVRENYFFGVFSCCFRSPRPREVQLRPSSVSSNNLRHVLANRPARWGMPAKMPVMVENESTKTGKFCLVLDLDETLVHSSFTVRHFFSLLILTSQMTNRSLHISKNKTNQTAYIEC